MTPRLTLACAICTSQAFGAPCVVASETIEEVLVTTTRQAYRGDIAIADTPQSITAIDVELIERAGITTLSETLDLSAAMARQNNFGGLWDNFATRGFAGDENLPSGYLVNGFNAGRGFGGPRDMSGVERVEILKGPNAALFGRGEPGGTINLVMKQPQFEQDGAVAVTAGSFDQYRGEADITGPVNDWFAYRVTGYLEENQSFRDTVESERSGLTPSLLLRIGERTSVTWHGEFTRQELPFDRGVVAVNGELGVMSRRTFLGEPDNGPIKADVDGHQVQIQHAFNDDWSLLAGVGLRDTDLEGFSSEAELAGSRQRLNRDGRTLSRQRRFRDYEAEHTVYRAELSGQFATGAIEHNVLIGADVDEFENSQLFLRFRPAAVSSNPSPAQGHVIDIFEPVYGQFALPIPGPQTNRLDGQEAWGIYLQDHIRISERLQVRIGGRYDDFEQSSLNRANNVRSKSSDTRFSPQAGVVFDMTDNVSVFAAYGEGFRQNAGANVAGEAFDPEESKSMELGLRAALLDGALTGSLSAFQIEKSNIITADPQNAGFSLAIGEAESRGIELEVSGRLPGEIDLWLSWAWIDAEAAESVLDPNFALLIEKGDELINIPEHTLSLLISRDFSLALGTVTLGAGLLYVSDRLGETATDFELPDYTLVRLLGSWAAGEHLEVAAEINNVFDETYYTNSFAQLWVAPGAPRNGSITVRYRF